MESKMTSCVKAIEMNDMSFSGVGHGRQPVCSVYAGNCKDLNNFQSQNSFFLYIMSTNNMKEFNLSNFYTIIKNKNILSFSINRYYWILKIELKIYLININF